MFFKLSLFLQLALQIVRIGHFDVLSAAIPARKGLKGGFSRLPFRKRIGMDNSTKFPYRREKSNFRIYPHPKINEEKLYAGKQIPPTLYKEKAIWKQKQKSCI